MSIGTTTVIALFKPVIDSAAVLDDTRAFVEQTTLVHEFGHGVGLVNNGIPNLADHHDAEHGAHCADDRCVMYWAVEGPADVAQFVQQVVTTGDVTLWGSDCLDDVAAVRGAAR